MSSHRSTDARGTSGHGTYAATCTTRSSSTRPPASGTASASPRKPPSGSAIAGHVTTRIQGEDAPTARDQLKQAIDTGLDGVLVVGGDGALHDVLDHVATPTSPSA